MPRTSKTPKPFKKAKHHDLYYVKKVGKATGKIAGVLALAGLAAYGLNKVSPILKKKLNEKLSLLKTNARILQQQLAQAKKNKENQDTIQRLQIESGKANREIQEITEMQKKSIDDPRQLVLKPETGVLSKEQQRVISEQRAKKLHEAMIENYKMKIAEIIFALTKHRVTPEELGDLCNTYKNMYKKLQNSCGMSWRDSTACADRVFKREGLRRQDVEKLLKEIGC
ncbi:MAG: hypothetical protein EHM20_01470 [Alphaproteobacteria bacterium]|nr:MAG: hypothetical protein EHJ95_05600 [Euryarchaeota archaeon]RPJ79415.1 MAG: hypothetical protein EHM20_01470 [Alphaproteobacteria bacterium]